MSSKGRAQAPTLPKDHLKSAQNLSSGSLSGQSSPFLTPPIPSPTAESPPPRPEAEDYLGASVRPGHRKRHHTRHVQKSSAPRQQASGLASPFRNIMESSEEMSTKCELCNEAEAKERRHGSLKSSTPRTLHGESPQAERGLIDAAVRAVRPPDKIALGERRASGHNDTPAMSALRRLSQPVNEDTQGLSGPLRRLSLAIASTLGFSDDLSSSTETVVGRRLSKEHQNNGVCAEGSSREADFKRSGNVTPVQDRRPAPLLNIPATISIRRASGVTPSTLTGGLETASKAETPPQEQGTRISPPSVELVAFYSEHKQTAIYMPSISQASPTSEPRKRTHSLTTAANPTDVRRQSCAADLAITYADIHIAPGTFSLSPNAREQPSASEAAAQRVSAVQLRSSSSVHEIIWREDESGSGSSISCSSQGSSSPLRATQFPTISTPNLDYAASLNQSSVVGSSKENQIPFLVQGESVVHGESVVNEPTQDGLSEFSWDKPNPAAKPENEQTKGRSSPEEVN